MLGLCAEGLSSVCVGAGLWLPRVCIHARGLTRTYVYLYVLTHVSVCPHACTQCGLGALAQELGVLVSVSIW